MQPKIIEKEAIKLIGTIFYGKMSGGGWSAENPIGKTWQRWGKFREANWDLIKDKVVNPDIAYEIHVWNEKEYKETGFFSAFVGLEVKDLDDVPLELVSMVLPASTYAIYTAKGKEITTTRTDEVLPELDYPRLEIREYRWEIQAYDFQRFKGLEGTKIDVSELDFYIPIQPTGPNTPS
ncbi:MAG: GyrI-like domain-containing protein [Candidatus Hodarchaeota archaeon]